MTFGMFEMKQFSQSERIIATYNLPPPHVICPIG